jgi:glutaredoxin
MSDGARVTVLSRVDCSACETAKAAVARVCDDLGVAWTSVDVDGDPELRAEYGDRIPVIMVDGSEHGDWKVDEARLRSQLIG